MQIGEVIRKYRIDKNMTQEKMAGKLGVTAPAVNKWENGKSVPDISLLAPIARLLGISVDTLLSFESELTTTEINQLIIDMDNKFNVQNYDEVFQWAKSLIEKYPNCEQLIYQIAVVLDAECMFDMEDKKEYYEFIYSCYERSLNSTEESIRNGAADSLFSFYIRKEQYEKAEEYLKYFSIQNPERKRKQAVIYENTGRREEAYKAYEELLFSGYQSMSIVFNSLFILNMQEDNKDKAHLMLEKQGSLAKIFDMGKYNEISNELEFVTAQKDVEGTLKLAHHMLEVVNTLQDFRFSPLYEHMKFKDTDPKFMEKLKVNLMKYFQDENTFEYMRNNNEWKEFTTFGNDKNN